MSFLDIFKRKPNNPKINVRIWINQSAKDKACIRMAQADKTIIFIAWSTVTKTYFQGLFIKQKFTNEILLAKDIIPSRITERKFVFLERHYDLVKENIVLKSLHASEIIAHVSLSDPLLSQFNAERIRSVLDEMGHREEEYINHKMIDKSIERAMVKIKNRSLKEKFPAKLQQWIDGIQ